MSAAAEPDEGQCFPVGSPEFQETYWTNPLGLGDEQLFRQFGIGSNTLYRLQEVAEPFMVSGRWRWYSQGKKTFHLAVKEGENTLTAVVKKSSDVQPRPTLRLYANAALGYAAQSTEDSTGTTEEHTLSIQFTASSAGNGLASIEHFNPTYGATVDWESISIS